MLAMCDTCLSELMKDLKGERYDAALDKAERMKKRIMRLKVHCRDCDERIVDEI